MTNADGDGKADVVAGQVVEAPDHVQVLPAGEVLVDRGVLTSQPDHPAYVVGVAGHVDARHGRPAGGGLEQGGEDADGGGLAGAVGPEQAVHGAVGDGEVDAVDGLDVAEVLDEPVGDDRVVCGHA